MLQQLKKLAELVILRFREINIVEISSSMTLATLLSIVPLLAVALAMFSVVPAFASYRQELEMLMTEAIPSQHSAQIFGYLKSFSAHARGLSAMGFAGLAVSAYFLIDRIFQTINRIFHVRQGRSFAQKALIYWALLTLGPVSMVASLSFTTYLAKLALSGLSGDFTVLGLKALSFLMQTLFFAALYYLIPNSVVKPVHALMGGAVTAAASFALKSGFTLYLSSGSLTNLYGTFVALPIFVLWIYVSWILVFAGAAVTATLPMISSRRFADGYRPGNRLITAAAVLETLYEYRLKDAPVVPFSQLCKDLDCWSEALNDALEPLEKLGYVSRVKRLKKSADSWVLTVDPEKATMRPVFEALSLDPDIKLLKKDDLQTALWHDELLNSPAINLTIAEAFLPEGSRKA